MIDSQDYCEQVSLYIHLNPVRARLVEDPVDHVFCGHQEFVGRIRDPLVDVDHALMSFGSTLKRGEEAVQGADSNWPGQESFGGVGRNLRIIGTAGS